MMNKLPIYLTWLPLGLIFIAIIFNTLTSIILLVNKDAKKVNCFKYLAVIAFFDTMCLFTWNLNEFLSPNFGFKIENLNIHTCRLFLFIQFISLQINSILRSLVCIERYYFVVKLVKPVSLGRKCFGSAKSVNFWIITTICAISFLNCHLLLNVGSHEEVKQYKDINVEQEFFHNKSIMKFNCYGNKKNIILKPLWNRVNLLTACIIPSVIMFIFDGLLIYRSYIAKQKVKSTIQRNKLNQSKSFTASLLFISTAHLLLHAPVNLYFSFFSDDANHSKRLLSFFFIQMHSIPHSILFFELYFSNTKFYKILLSYYEGKKRLDKIRIELIVYNIQNEQNISVIDNNMPVF
jgi:hypothetical protein